MYFGHVHNFPFVNGFFFIKRQETQIINVIYRKNEYS